MSPDPTLFQYTHLDWLIHFLNAMRCQFKIKCVFALVISNIDTMKTNLTCFWMTFIFAAMKCIADELKSKVLSLSVTCFYTSDLSLHCLKETKFSSA